MEFETKVDANWNEVARKLKGADKTIRKELTAGVRAASKPIERDLKSAILATDSAARGGGGGRQRAEHKLNRNKRLDELLRAEAGGDFSVRQKIERAEALAHRRSGLRASIASAIQTKISYSGFRIGVRLRVDTARMPRDQRRLPRYMNRGRWRHPVMGNREAWVTQTTTPVGWWTNTIRRHVPRARREINAALDRARRQLN